LAVFALPVIRYFRAPHGVFEQANFFPDPNFGGFIILKSWQNFEFLKIKNPASAWTGAGILLLIIKTYKRYWLFINKHCKTSTICILLILFVELRQIAEGVNKLT